MKHSRADKLFSLLPEKAKNFPGNGKFFHDPMNANAENSALRREHIKPLPHNLHFCRDGKEQKFVVSGFSFFKVNNNQEFSLQCCIVPRKFEMSLSVPGIKPESGHGSFESVIF